MPLTKVTGGEIDNNSSINISSYSVTGVATFSGGPVLIGSGTSTGTASQRLQVTGGAYVSGNLGIGVTNPTTKLDVFVNGGEGLPSVVTGERMRVISNDVVGRSGFLSIIAGSSAYSGIFFGDKDAADVGKIRYYHADNSLQFLVNGSSNPTIHLDNVGNLLVGTSTPTGSALQPLQVNGGAYVSGSVGIGNTVPFSSLGKLIVSSNSSIPEIRTSSGNIINPNNTGSEITGSQITVGSNIIFAEKQPDTAFSDRTDLAIITNTGYGLGQSEKVRIKAEGDVGIGTINPAAKLHVLGNAIRHQATNPYVEFYQLNGTNTGYIQSRTTDFRFNSVGSIPVTFGTNDIERVRIDSSGRLLIGTQSSGLSRVSIVSSGTQGISTSIQLTGTDTANATWWIATPASSLVAFGGNTDHTIAFGGFNNATGAFVERARIDSSGNFGIGGSPGAKLQVGGGADSTGIIHLFNSVSSSESGKILFRTNNNFNASLGIAAISASDGGTVNQSRGNLIFSTSLDGAPTERARIDFSGNLGIATTSPGDKLTVLGRVQIQQATDSSSRLVFRAKPGNLYRWSLDNDGSSNDFRIFREDDVTAANGALYVSLNSSGNLTLNNGNLVIGTSGKGIDFSAVTNAPGMTSELLNDYEEGTWTPVISSDGTPPTVSHSTQLGNYTKIGNVVYVRMALNFNITGAGSGVVTVSLPFTAANYTVNWQHTRTGYAAGAVSIEQIAPRFNSATASLYSSLTSADTANVTGTRVFSVNLFYFVS